MGNRFPSLMSAIRRQLPFFAFLAESMPLPRAVEVACEPHASAGLNRIGRHAWFAGGLA
jgi:hypothetical protein